MSKLTDNQKHLLKLIQRSNKTDGWSHVAETLRPFITALCAEIPELVIYDPEHKVRLTQEGETVLKWL